MAKHYRRSRRYAYSMSGLDYLNPFLDKIHLQLPFGFIGNGKVIADARAADLQTETECFSFYMKKIVIGRYERITFEIVSRNVHSFKTSFRTSLICAPRAMRIPISCVRCVT